MRGFIESNELRSAITFSLIVIKAWHADKKYRVNNLSPILFSCGITLSVKAIIFVFLFLPAILIMVPNAGAINGIQNLNKIISGASFFNSFPTDNQLKGLIEFILVRIFLNSGGGPSEYWVFPGNKKEGY